MLTVKQPWATLILKGIKTVENRSWYPDCEWILIHSGYNYSKKISNILKKKYPLLLNYKNDKNNFPQGKILCIVHIRNCYRVNMKINNNIFEKGPICWKIDKVIPLIEKINISGSNKLWNLPNNMITNINYLI